MKPVKINGYTYYYNEVSGKLFIDEESTVEVEMKFLTPNEKMQLETYTKYNGVPMYSYYSID